MLAVGVREQDAGDEIRIERVDPSQSALVCSRPLLRNRKDGVRISFCSPALEART
jgi:hypothetical protein